MNNDVKNKRIRIARTSIWIENQEEKTPIPVLISANLSEKAYYLQFIYSLCLYYIKSINKCS